MHPLNMLSPSIFSRKLIKWSLENPRNYPWIGEQNPYKIWISEIILQQTRSEQGKSYYLNFIKKFPDIKTLANASEDEVLQAWEGLGYYTRARNLHIAAKTINSTNNGQFPENYETIKSLKGIGDYTAAAISSFAYNLPYPVIDGNVIRVFSRILGIFTTIETASGKKFFTEIANKYLHKSKAAIYNQAIMNFGAIQCKPQNPLCETCIFLKTCFAYNNQQIQNLPAKKKKIQIRKRFFHYFIIRNKKGEFALQKRIKKDIWKHLYEPPMLETNKNISLNSIEKNKDFINLFESNNIVKFQLVAKNKQKLSHQELFIKIYIPLIDKQVFKIKPGFSFVKPKNLVNFALPMSIGSFLEKFNQNNIC